MKQHVHTRQLALFALLAGSLQPVAAAPHDMFGAIAGFWTGPGRIEFEGGTSEALLCKAYYANTDHAESLSIVLRCASRSQKIELRARLIARGSKLTGTWEERTYNATGTATGEATDQKISLSVDGGGFSATMLVVNDGGSQSVSISTAGAGFKGVSVSLVRGTSSQNVGER
jgi:hypothetical protein